MSDQLPSSLTSRGLPRRALPTGLAVSALTLYTAIFLAHWPWKSPVALREFFALSTRFVYKLVDVAFGLFDVATVPPLARHGVYLVIVGSAIPWLFMAIFGRWRPSDLGLRIPNVFGWRICVVGYFLATPFLIWMLRDPSFSQSYLREFERAGATLFVLYYLVNMATEHLFLHGIVLAACRRGRRWPAPQPSRPISASGFRAVFQWLGLAQEIDEGRSRPSVTQWMGLASGCVPAVCTSALLFAMVHVGKNPRELILSIPGGIALAFVAYRTNSWLTTFILHSATAGTVLLIMLIRS